MTNAGTNYSARENTGNKGVGNVMRRTILGLLGGLTAVSGAFAQSTAGTSTMKYDSGAVYEGQFKDGKQHGKGKYTAPDGYQYDGQWVNGVIQGKGKAKFPNGSVYEGEFKDGLFHGWGRRRQLFDREGPGCTLGAGLDQGAVSSDPGR